MPNTNTLKQETFFGGRNELNLRSFEEMDNDGINEDLEHVPADNSYLSWDDEIDAELNGGGEEDEEVDFEQTGKFPKQDLEKEVALEITEEFKEHDFEKLESPMTENFHNENHEEIIIKEKARGKFYKRNISFQNFSNDMVHEKLPGKKDKRTRSLLNEKSRAGKNQSKMRQRDWRVAGSILQQYSSR